MTVGYNIFRWYRAGWGRYTQADPIIAPGVEYPYAIGNPVRHTDRYGLFDTGSLAKDITRQLIKQCERPGGFARRLPFIGILLSLAHADDIEENDPPRDCDECKTQRCKPCIPPVGTRAYREDTNPMSPPHRGVPPPHWKLYEMNQNPNNCQCFWVPIPDNRGGFGPSPPPPGIPPITPAAGGGFF